jgi:hypothetical protein
MNLQKQHKDFLELEVRKFKRRKLLQRHQLDQDQLREVNIVTLSGQFLEKITSTMGPW